jgi:hypothetical protein
VVTVGVQLRIVDGGYALPLDPVLLARENDFEVRHILRGLGLTLEQITAVEAAVAAVRRGEYGRPR